MLTAVCPGLVRWLFSFNVLSFTDACNLPSSSPQTFSLKSIAPLICHVTTLYCAWILAGSCHCLRRLFSDNLFLDNRFLNFLDLALKLQAWHVSLVLLTHSKAADPPPQYVQRSVLSFHYHTKWIIQQASLCMKMWGFHSIPSCWASLIILLLCRGAGWTAHMRQHLCNIWQPQEILACKLLQLCKARRHSKIRQAPCWLKRHTSQISMHCDLQFVNLSLQFVALLVRFRHPQLKINRSLVPCQEKKCSWSLSNCLM